MTRVAVAYPPPPPPARPTIAADHVETLVARPARSTRSRGTRRRPRAARLWAGLSALLAVAGVAAIVAPPEDGSAPARLDVPAAIAPPLPASGVAAPPAVSTDPATGSMQMAASAPVRVQIPALGVTSRIVELGLQRDGSMEVPTGAYPVGWYDGSPTPGQLGAAVLAGHVDWGGERGAFYGLRELRHGDTVVVDRADGTTATFRVDRVEEHAKDEFPTEAVYGQIDQAGLRLITCGGAFDEDAGDYRDNVIVFASLVAAG